MDQLCEISMPPTMDGFVCLINSFFTNEILLTLAAGATILWLVTKTKWYKSTQAGKE